MTPTARPLLLPEGLVILFIESNLEGFFGSIFVPGDVLLATWAEALSLLLDVLLNVTLPLASIVEPLSEMLVVAEPTTTEAATSSFSLLRSALNRLVESITRA